MFRFVRTLVPLLTTSVAGEAPFGLDCGNVVDLEGACKVYAGQVSNVPLRLQGGIEYVIEKAYEGEIATGLLKDTPECKEVYNSLECAESLLMCDKKHGKILRPCRSACIAMMTKCSPVTVPFEWFAFMCEKGGMMRDMDCMGRNDDFLRPKNNIMMKETQE